MPEPVSSATPLPPETRTQPASARPPTLGAVAPDVLAKGQFGSHFGLRDGQKVLPKDKALGIARAAGFTSVGALQRFVGIPFPDHLFGEQTFLRARAFLMTEADRPQSALQRDRLAKLAVRLFPADHPVVAKLADNPAQKVLDAFSGYVSDQAEALAAGVEMDCADFAGYLWNQFSAGRGVADGLPGTFETLTQNDPKRGIWGVNPQTPTIVNDTLHAKLFERQYAEPIVLDRPGTAVTGKTFRAGGRTLDYGQLRPGDILFYRYTGDGASHTMVVLGNDPANGQLKLAYGNYSSVRNQDFERIGFNPLPITIMTLPYGARLFTGGLMGAYQVKTS